MAKKIYDIYPPCDQKKNKTMDSCKSKRKGKNIPFKFSFKKTLIFLTAVFLIFIITSHTVFLKAEVIIWPETTKVSYSGEITIDPSIYSLNLKEKTIPGEIFEIKEKESRTFFSTGKETEGKRAEGTLKVYNNYSSSPQSLVENTRFISADGKLFHSTERITIPGRRQEGSRTIPGETKVSIKAAEPGEEYNMERTSKFSVPGLQGTALYTEIYAENDGPIAGGHVGELPLITEQDIENARDVLISDLSSRAKSKIEEEAADNFIIESELIEQNVSEESFYPGIGENSESFEYSMNINFRVISFKKSDIQEKIKKGLLDNESLLSEKNDVFSEKEIFEQELKINFSPKLINFRSGEAVLEFKSEVPVYSKVNKQEFTNNLSGKKIKEVETIMKNYSEILDFDLNYWPFWINVMPKSDKISVEIKIEK